MYSVMAQWNNCYVKYVFLAVVVDLARFPMFLFSICSSYVA